jgi:hypothetical protein
VARTAMVEVVRLFLLLLLLFYFLGKQTGGLGKLKLVGREEGIYVESTGGVGPRGIHGRFTWQRWSCWPFLGNVNLITRESWLCM